ncbi:MAG: hypothetical protein K2J91_07085 [Lachnospiraceae bacterium]|nr:hypothetical protein [Lachnospiraceae bacterium]
MWINNLEHKKLETVIILARMYGVKETLEPLPCIRIIGILREWDMIHTKERSKRKKI